MNRTAKMIIFGLLLLIIGVGAKLLGDVFPNFIEIGDNELTTQEEQEIQYYIYIGIALTLFGGAITLGTYMSRNYVPGKKTGLALSVLSPILFAAGVGVLAWGANKANAKAPDISRKLKQIALVVIGYKLLVWTTPVEGKGHGLLGYARNFIDTGNYVNRFIFSICILYIFHTLWVILTFTSPTAIRSIELPPEKRCDLDFLYYGKYPIPTNDSNNSDINKYIFDITTWFPPLLEDDPDYTCQPCPNGMTPKQNPTKPNLSCRSCTDNEEWISLKDIKSKYDNKLLTSSEIKHLDTTFPQQGSWDEALATLTHDGNNSWTNVQKAHTTINEPSQQDEFGMCFPKKDTDYSSRPYRGTTCDSYTSCMESSDSFIEVSWPTSEQVFPGQEFNAYQYSDNLLLTIPDKPYSTDCSPDTKYDNIYNNQVCNESRGTNDDSRCYFQFPVSPKPSFASPMPESGMRLTRTSGRLSACDTVNSLAQTYNNMDSVPNPELADINMNTGKRFINTGEIAEGSKTTASDWRAVLDTVYTECNNQAGNCYIDDFVCTTQNGTALPLVDHSGPTPLLTLPEYTDPGCNNIVVTDNCSIHDAVCNALSVNDSGDVITTPGKCRYSTWSDTNTNWTKLDEEVSIPPSDYYMRCFPNNKLSGNGNILSNITGPSPLTPQVADNICKTTTHLTDPILQAELFTGRMCGSGTGTGSGSDSNSAVSHGTVKSCSEPPQGMYCPIPKSGELTYTADGNFNGNCCISGTETSSPDSPDSPEPTIYITVDKTWPTASAPPPTLPSTASLPFSDGFNILLNN